MSQILVFLLASTALGACQESRVPTPQPGPSAAEKMTTVTPATKPPVPAFKPGMVVLDTTGAKLGVVQTVTETPGGSNVVIGIDGKLIGVLPTTLQLRGETAVSIQTKDQILANDGAPP